MIEQVGDARVVNLLLDSTTQQGCVFLATIVVTLMELRNACLVMVIARSAVRLLVFARFAMLEHSLSTKLVSNARIIPSTCKELIIAQTVLDAKTVILLMAHALNVSQG